MPLLFVINLASCLLMTGLIWLIQLVHYPAFKYIGDSNFTAFHQFHTQSISYIVLPLMFIELVSSFYLAYQLPSYQISLQFALGIVIIIWISTFTLQVPAHNALANGFNEIQYQKLISTNWLRTIGWSLRSLILLFILYSIIVSK